MASTMKEAIVAEGPRVTIIDSEIPTPEADQLVIKTVISGSNPKDWKAPQYFQNEINQGDDIAGYVHEVGSNVTEFKPGDRVAAFHELFAVSGGSYAEYSVAWAHATFHLPKKTSFEEAATLPLAVMSAAIGLYAPHCLSLPSPLRPATSPIPLVIYGGASAVGDYAIQFAKRSNIHPLIVIAGRGQAFVESLIEPAKGDVFIDYRAGDAAVVQGIRNALKGQKLEYAFDAIAEHGSTENVLAVLEEGGKITSTLHTALEKVPKTVSGSFTHVACVHQDCKDFGYVYFRLVARALQDRWLKGHPYEVVPGGLGGIQTALDNLKAGKASALKYLFRLADTEGVTGDSV